MGALLWKPISTRRMSGVKSALQSSDGRFLLTKGRGYNAFWVGHDTETQRPVTGISPDKYGELRALKVACEELAV